MTTYVVFRRTSVTGGIPPYQRLGQVDAHDGKSAIAKAISEILPEEQRAAANEETFAATTVRSWTEASPEVQLELKVRVR